MKREVRSPPSPKKLTGFSLEEGGAIRSYSESVGGVLRRRKVKLKTGRPRPGRPRHEKADEKEQEAFRKKFAEKVSAKGEERSRSSVKPLKVMAFDEARFGLINWHRRRYYCPKGFSPYTVRRAYEWTYLSMRPRGPYDGRELVRVVPAGHGRPVFFGGVLGATGQRSIR